VRGKNELFPYLLKLKQAADLHSNRLSQWLVLSQLQGDFAGHLARLRTLYRERRDQMHAALSEQLGEAANWQCPPGGLFFWLQLNTPGIDTRTLLPEAMARGLAFMPGEPFFPNAPAAVSAMRLNFSHSDPASLRQGVRLLAELLHEQQEG
jgi:DNA-binding transcriptional MocR family regulator